MASHTFDIVFIGSGPGGYVSAIRAAQLGMKAAVVEKEHLGGVCLNWGCIPTKALLRNAEIIAMYKRKAEWGVTFSNFSANFGKAVQRSREVAELSEKGVDFLFKKNKITVLKGAGRLTAKKTVQVQESGGKTIDEISAKYIVLATGASPRSLPGMEFDGKQILDSTDAMLLKKEPQSMAIIGAGAVGVEYAYVYAMYGTKVSLIEMMPQLLPVEDQEIAKHLERAFKKDGMNIRLNTKVTDLEKKRTGVELTLDTKGKSDTVTVETVLVAVGRTPNITDLGLKEVGVAVASGFIKVNHLLETSVKGIYAIGDVARPPLLAHKASAEGVLLVENLVRKTSKTLDMNRVPSCTYCQPQVASIGLTEAEVKAKKIAYKVGRFPFRANGKSRALGETDGLVKIIKEEKYGEILGVHIIGSEATELIAEASTAKALEATVESLTEIIHAHPTMAEAILEAALDAEGRLIHM